MTTKRLTIKDTVTAAAIVAFAATGVTIAFAALAARAFITDRNPNLPRK